MKMVPSLSPYVRTRHFSTESGSLLLNAPLCCLLCLQCAAGLYLIFSTESICLLLPLCGFVTTSDTFYDTRSHIIHR